MASDDLRARIAEAIRAAACDGHCGRSEEDCAAANPIEEVVSHFGQVAVVEAPVDALAEVAASAVQPELDRLTAERNHLASACRDMRRRLTVLGAALPPGLDFYVGKIKAMRNFLANAVADIPPTNEENRRG